MRIRTLVGCLLLGTASTAIAQHHGPYTGQQNREIKALSPQEMQDYLEGKGMGYAKAAELNHYPGPAHALELADRLELTPEQRAAVERLRNSHRAEAKAIGAKRVESERGLEVLFRSGKASEDELAAAVRDAAILDGQYRLSHLETHRRTRALLTDEQVVRYDKLRGY